MGESTLSSLEVMDGAAHDYLHTRALPADPLYDDAGGFGMPVWVEPE